MQHKRVEAGKRMRLVAADLNPAMIEDNEYGAGLRGPRRGWPKRIGTQQQEISTDRCLPL
jgi:hypothetical protein